jgi:benzodiazapine receptor
MPNTRKMSMMPSRDMVGLFVFIVLCFLLSAAGGAITATSVGIWFQELQKPSFNPPDWIFAPVWTILYLLMAIAGWLVWRTVPHKQRRLGLLIFAVQLSLNFTWSLLFFGLQAPQELH